ncbi:hypothetical protein AHAS_Ahas20G0035600 [Arachis hypogaea]
MLDVLQSISLIAEVQDKVVWQFDKEDIYSTNSFVHVLQEETLTDDVINYRFTNDIWKGLVPPRVELFTWFVLIGRMNSKDRLTRLCIIDQGDNMCILCRQDVENAPHLFVTCAFSW